MPIIKARRLTAESLSSSQSAILSQASFLASAVVTYLCKMSDQNEHLSRLNLDGFTNGLVSYVAILNDYLLMHLLFIRVQCHNYISGIYNKSNRLKIGRKCMVILKSTCTKERPACYWRTSTLCVDLHLPAARKRLLPLLCISMCLMPRQRFSL